VVPSSNRIHCSTSLSGVVLLLNTNISVSRPIGINQSLTFTISCCSVHWDNYTVIIKVDKTHFFCTSTKSCSYWREVLEEAAQLGNDEICVIIFSEVFHFLFRQFFPSLPHRLCVFLVLFLSDLIFLLSLFSFLILSYLPILILLTPCSKVFFISWESFTGPTNFSPFMKLGAPPLDLIRSQLNVIHFEIHLNIILPSKPRFHITGCYSLPVFYLQYSYLRS